MKRITFVILFFFTLCAQQINAQDTIDTTYYRYLFIPSPPSEAFLWRIQDTVMDIVILDSFNLCPNGGGYQEEFICEGNCIHFSPGAVGANQKLYYRMPRRDATDKIFGLALLTDSVANLNDNDSLIIQLFVNDTVDEVIHKRIKDSIVLKSSTIGRIRYLGLPMMKRYFDEGGPLDGQPIFFASFIGDASPDPLRNCVERVFYAQVLEVYFPSPITWIENDMYLSLRKNEGGEMKLFWHSAATYGVGSNSSGYTFYCEDNTLIGGGGVNPMKNFIIPIKEPLPDWEMGMMDTVLLRLKGATDTTVSDTSDVSGIRGVEMELGMRVYPNPASEEVTVRSDGEMERYEVYDIMGRMVSRGRVEGREAKVDVRGLRSGMYELRVKGPRGMAVRRVSVRR